MNGARQRQPMPGLLVSVRSLEEFRTACVPGVSVIDIKEPTRGSLGPADWSTVRAIAEAAGGETPLSLALGELLEVDWSAMGAWPSGIGYAKFGLAECVDRGDWFKTWCDAWQRLPSGIGRVAVAYADASVAKSPGWQAVLDAGLLAGCHVLLIDTFGKTSGNLLRWLDLDELQEVRRACTQAGVRLALAGSLRPHDFASLAHIQPDLLAVRSAVCSESRNGALSTTALAEVVRELRRLQQVQGPVTHGPTVTLGDDLTAR